MHCLRGKKPNHGKHEGYGGMSSDMLEIANLNPSGEFAVRWVM
jgi:hypothetical protein